MTQETLGLGRPIPQDAVHHRDAIHIAVVPVTIDKMCRPGQKVGLTGFSVGNEPIVSPIYEGDSVGVIDPYLVDPVVRGQRCWLYLNPGSITSLRHDWTHPAFEVAHDA